MNDIPTGSSSEVVRDYFNHLYGQYLLQPTQNYYVHWDTILWFAFWVIMLIALFFFYTRWQRTSQAKKEPYPVESYNGYIQESNGPVGAFLTVFFIVMFVWALIITYMSLTRGQVY